MVVKSADIVKFEAEDFTKEKQELIQVEQKPELFKRIEPQLHFYFDHSYYAACEEQNRIAHCAYGVEIPAIVMQENITGIQFHPEKSQQNGLKLFRNYFNYLGF